MRIWLGRMANLATSLASFATRHLPSAISRLKDLQAKLSLALGITHRRCVAVEHRNLGHFRNSSAMATAHPSGSTEAGDLHATTLPNVVRERM